MPSALQPLDGVEQEESAVAALELQLQEVKAERLNERFIWVSICFLMGFPFISRDLNFVAVSFLALLSLCILIFLANLWKVPVVTPYLVRIFEYFITRKLNETE